jgi:hypothetical protein
MCPQASHEVSVHTRPYSSNRVHGRTCSPPHLGHLMVRNQGDARKWLLASVIPVRHSPWFENGPDESLPLLYHPGLIARISDMCSLK